MYAIVRDRCTRCNVATGYAGVTPLIVAVRDRDLNSSYKCGQIELVDHVAGELLNRDGG